MLLRILWEDFKAWRRGERRIVPRFDVNGRPIQGRVYAKRGEVAVNATMAKAEPGGRMSLRVYRAATGKWEDPVDMGPIYREKR